MSQTVSDIIAARSREPEGLRTMIVWSVAAHVAVMAVLLAMPLPEVDDEPRVVMMVSLGGAAGPQTAGQTQLGGRAVQAPEPETPLTARRAETAPAPAAPRMTIPEPPRPAPPPPQPRQATPPPEPAPRPRPAPAQAAPPRATGRTPVTGPEPRAGSTPVDTGARGQGFGLSSGGGGGGGGITLDVSDFCCPEYLIQMRNQIQRTWSQGHGVGGETVVRFTILSDGTIQGIRVASTSGHWALDNAAERAVHVAGRLPPLPPQFTNPTLTVNLTFEYQR